MPSIFLYARYAITLVQRESSRVERDEITKGSVGKEVCYTARSGVRSVVQPGAQVVDRQVGSSFEVDG